MTGKVINLRRARKARARATERREAAANAARHGEAAVVCKLRDDEAERLRRTVDGARRDRSVDDDTT
jgi:hypothetical protein